ncbi:putative magnesium transporter NIPA8 [Nosema granulosis]|uniref:Magnesium transporter NIPA8 n=1 Tax=Nosema granulosis TaxID=83296 RepID=A0A9P6GXB2_9MICR|nr:putative magnesium transporter NIPA8 [Nosema granulosis]
MFLILLEVAKCSTIIPCATDNDCLVRNRPDVHSYYCVDNICQKIVPPGKHCHTPKECASYSFYGPLACSSKCRVETECDLSRNTQIETPYCCKSIPEKKRCNPNRPTHLSGCDIKQACVLSREGHYTCVSKKSNGWIVGVFLSVTGNICINTGVNIQKKSYTKSAVTLFGIDMSMFYLGCFIYFIGKIFGYSSYVFGNQSLLAALSATGLVSNSILAPLINQEIFTWKDVCAIFFVFSGTTLIVMNTKISHKIYSLCELLKMYKRTDTILWFGFILLTIAGLYFFTKFVETNSDWELPEDYFGFLRKEEVWFEEEGFVMKYVMILAYVWLSSFIASFTTLSIKSLGEIIDKTLSGDNQFTSSVTYIFIVGLVVCTFGQIYWLNRALRRYDALLVVPLFHISWTILSIFTAGIYFQEFEHYSRSQFTNFILGIGIIFIGSLFLASRITSRNRIDIHEETSTKTK